MDEHFDSNLGPMSCNPMGRAAAHGSGATPGAGVSGTDSGGPTGQAEAKTRMGKRKRATGCSSNESILHASSGDSTLPYEAPVNADESQAREQAEMDRKLALFLGLRGIAKDAVQKTGLEFYFAAYGYGTAAERAEILPQVEAELLHCNMRKMVQFFRHFLSEEDFAAFTGRLLEWIQDAQPTTGAEHTVRPEQGDPHAGLPYYLDTDKEHLLQIYGALCEEEALRTCAPFERRLRKELLERALLPAEAEQVAWLLYDATPSVITMLANMSP